MKLFLDVTRIATRIIGSAPTGIDRVEYAYATEILRNHTDVDPVSVLTTPLFSGALRGAVIEEILARVANAWRLHQKPDQDRVYQDLKRHLETPVDEQRSNSFRVRGERPVERAVKQGYYPVRSLVRASTRLKRRIDRSNNQNRCYLNSSHTQLEHIERFLWTSSAAIKSVFFIHDLIPIDYPEFVSPPSCARHEGRLHTVSQLASAIIVNSDYTRRSVEKYLSAKNLPLPPVAVNPLGVSEWFSQANDLDTPKSAVPYFVAVSTLEPRKNFIFLFAVWRRLVELLGSKAPRLVVVGRRGWENENVIDILERSRSLGPFLVEATDLTDAGLASLLTGAQALIAPSTVEGFGLPIAEALALGVPVIASDIEAHHEVAGKCGTFINAIDGIGWLRAIERFLDSSQDMARRIIRETYKPRTHAEHVRDSLSFMSSFLSSVS
jgi:glycosyltransferase involved in cell wall biosynthesis